MNGFFQSLKNLGPGRLAAMIGVAVLMIGIFIYMTTKMASSPMELLYGDLEGPDARQIMQKLDAAKIHYDVKNNGAQIFVPSDQVGKLRVQLAEVSMPSGGASVGYEIFDKGDPLGATNFMQNLNLVRALEGELSKTVKSISGVKNARVHLVMPKREMFTRELQEPTASIVLKMSGSQRLNKQQVLAVQHIVSGAVPRMKPQNISIVDEKGTLLSRGGEDSKALMTASIEEMKIAQEQRMVRSLEEMIERSVGPGKVRAEVAIEMDFDRMVVNEERFDPDSQVVRSTRTIGENNQSSEAEPSSVSVGQNLPDAGASSSGGRASTKENRTDELVNYEINRKVINQTRETGVTKRLSVAILVDGTYEGDPGSRIYKPRKQEELDQMATLVRSAIGFDGKRGDNVEVVNMPFALSEEELVKPPQPFLFGMEKADVLRMAEVIVLSVVAILVILLVVRPLVTRAFESMPTTDATGRRLFGEQPAPQLAPPPVPSVPVIEEIDTIDELIDIDKVEGRVKASSIKKIGEIVDKHPEEALSIIRNWMYQENS